MKTILLVATIIVVVMAVCAQDVEAQQLDPDSLGCTCIAADRLLAQTDNRSLWGWN